MPAAPRKWGETQLGVSLPVALSVRLDHLLERVRGAGERTSRKELVAALIQAAPEDGAAIDDLVVAARTAPVRRAVVQGFEVSAYLGAPRSPPGPRVSQTGRPAPSRGREPNPGRDAAIDPELPLRDAPERRVGLAVPREIARRLDRLVRAVERNGGRATRMEVLAGVVLAAPEEADAIVELVRSWRRRARRASPKRR